MAITYRNFPAITDKIRNHFWSKVSVKAPSQCWLWLGGTIPARGNYGRFYIHRKDFRAHRVAYCLWHGIDPGSLDVLHSCDNPPCCNPHHLSLGTRADNHRDMDSKGRRAFGVDHGIAKLTPEQVKEIRQRYIPRVVSMATLAHEYGVCQMTINNIIHNKIWVGV